MRSIKPKFKLPKNVVPFVPKSITVAVADALYGPNEPLEKSLPNGRIATEKLNPFFCIKLERLLEQNNRKAYDKKGKYKRDCSTATRIARRTIFYGAFSDLYRLGFPLRDPANLRPKHIAVLAVDYRDRGLSPQTINARFSALRVLCGWLGKPGMVGQLRDIYPNWDGYKRTQIATESKAWISQGIDSADLIGRAEKIDERFALYLSLQRHFGMRVKESIQFAPLHSSADELGFVEIYRGSKGGRPRLIPIVTDEQKHVLDWAKRVALASGTNRIRWNDLTWKQSQSRFYGYMKRIGATKAKLGVTAHGLRHEYAQKTYEEKSGYRAPVDGQDPKVVDREIDKLAKLKVSWELGHGRPDVATYYVGSHGHKLRHSAKSVSSNELWKLT